MIICDHFDAIKNKIDIRKESILAGEILNDDKWDDIFEHLNEIYLNIWLYLLEAKKFGRNVTQFSQKNFTKNKNKNKDEQLFKKNMYVFL